MKFIDAVDGATIDYGFNALRETVNHINLAIFAAVKKDWL